MVDFIDPPMNIIQSIADGLGIGMDIVTIIESVFSSMMDILMIGMEIAASIMQVLTVFLTSFGTIMIIGMLILFSIMVIAFIVMLIAGGKAWHVGYRNHMDCAKSEFDNGVSNTNYVFKVLATCGWYKFLNFLNGSCTRYYIIDMVLGILYGIFIEFPLILINAILGINFAPLVKLIYDMTIIPLDALFFALSGFHLVKWPKSVIDKCYRCEGEWKFKNGQKVKIHKTYAEWSQLFNCSFDQIFSGLGHIFTTFLPSSRWWQWFNKENQEGSDWNPAFWGIPERKDTNPPPPSYSSASDNLTQLSNNNN